MQSAHTAVIALEEHAANFTWPDSFPLLRRDKMSSSVDLPAQQDELHVALYTWYACKDECCLELFMMLAV